MGRRTRAAALGLAVLTGLAVAGGTAGAAQARVADGGPDVGVLNFWFEHSSYDTREKCEAAARNYLWPYNPTGADDYECRADAGRWDLWLMFLS